MVNQNAEAGEGKSDKGKSPKLKSTNLRAEAPEYEPDPQWPILRRVKTSRGRKDQVENPFPKLKLGESYETFRLGKGSYRPTHAKSRKRETLLEKEAMRDREYAPGITCGQVWCLLNGGDAVEILADTTLTQRAKRAILAQKDLINREALERIIRNEVGSDYYDEYYSDAVAESEESGGESDSEDQSDSEEEETSIVRGRKASTPLRRAPTPRRLQFRERPLEVN